MDIGSSVTRFGEISPLWQQKLKSLAILGSSLAKFWPSLANFYAIGAIFVVVNSQILKTWSSHLVTLIDRDDVKWRIEIGTKWGEREREKCMTVTDEGNRMRERG